jgi:hypothetical protein
MSNRTESPMVCEHCGTVGQPLKKKPGHTAVSVICLLFGLVTLVLFWPVGLIFLVAWVGYGIYRLAATRVVCSSCGRHDSLLSPDSPRGRKVVADFSTNSSATSKP